MHTPLNGRYDTHKIKENFVFSGILRDKRGNKWSIRGFSQLSTFSWAYKLFAVGGQHPAYAFQFRKMLIHILAPILSDQNFSSYTLMGALWYSGSDSRLTIRGSHVRIPPSAYALRHFIPDCLSLPRCINGYPEGCERYCWWVGIVRARNKATGLNAPQGVEKEHFKCRTDTESYDRGNNTLWSALIMKWKSAI